VTLTPVFEILESVVSRTGEQWPRARRPTPLAEKETTPMPRIRYQSDAQSLFFPGEANDFFPLGVGVSESALCAEMARAAYVKHESPGGRDRLSRILRSAGFTVVDHLDVGGTQGFIADGRTSEGEPIRVVAFRGTQSDDPRDLIADLEFWPHAWGDRAKVHHGFAEALTHVHARVTQSITQAPCRVVVTGHSLGAALATLVASLHKGARLYTFGSPRVGNAAFSEMISPERHWRYVDYVDLVTRVPSPSPFLDYVHVGSAHFIDADGEVHPLPDEDIRTRQAAGQRPDLGIGDLLRAFRERAISLNRDSAWRDLTDHAPINYVAALMRLPAQASTGEDH